MKQTLKQQLEQAELKIAGLEKHNESLYGLYKRQSLENSELRNKVDPDGVKYRNIVSHVRAARTPAVVLAAILGLLNCVGFLHGLNIAPITKVSELGTKYGCAERPSRYSQYVTPLYKLGCYMGSPADEPRWWYTDF